MEDDPPESTADRWIRAAEDDLAVAQDLQGLGHVAPSAFYAQQAAEKALKAVQIHRQRTLDRTHDLLRLARLLKAGQHLEERATFLSQFYTGARYPDMEDIISEEDAESAIQAAGEVVRWAQTQLS